MPIAVIFFTVGLPMLIAVFVWRNQTLSQSIKVIVTTLLLAGSPLFLGILLFIFNPDYIGRAVFSCANREIFSTNLCSQPYGWVSLSIIFAFVVIGHLGIGTALSSLKNKYLYIVVAQIWILFVLPAILLMIFTPAILLIIETQGLGI